MSTVSLFLIVTIILVADINAADNPTPDQYIKKVNSLRAQVAEKLKIANMHELTWNTWLENQVKKNKKHGCEAGMRWGEDWRFYPVEANGDETTLGRHNHSDHISDYNSLKDITNPDFLFPLNTRVGCDFDYECRRKKWQFHGLCYIGPTYSMDGYKIGPPGSQCGDFESKGGLCTSTPKKARIESSSRSYVLETTGTYKKKETSDSTDGVSSSTFMISCLIPMLFMI